MHRRIARALAVLGLRALRRSRVCGWWRSLVATGAPAGCAVRPSKVLGLPAGVIGYPWRASPSIGLLGGDLAVLTLRRWCGSPTGVAPAPASLTDGDSGCPIVSMF